MGRLVISGANTFTTAFAVNQGAVRLASNFALGATAGGVTVANNYGAVLEINPGLSLPGAVTRATTAASVTGNGLIPMANPAGLVVGMSVTGTNVPGNSFITAVNGAAVVTRATTAAAGTGQAVITTGSVAGLAVGMLVTGTNVPGNAFITAVGATTVTINANIGTTIASGTSLTFNPSVTINNNIGTAIANGASLSFLAEGITINSSGVNYGGALLGLAGSASSIGGALTIGTAGAVIGAESAP